MNILFVTHADLQCGIYQYGANTAKILSASKMYGFIHAVCTSPADLWRYINQYQPGAIIYNYHPSVLGWVNSASSQLSIKQLAIQHEPVLPPPVNICKLISQDPTVLEDNQTFSPGRFILNYENKYPEPEIVTIGSFGFGFPGKGFQRLVATVQNEYDDAIIKLHLAYATYGDAAGNMARATADECRALVIKPGIKLEITHDFKDISQLIDWLAQNSINAFFYDFFPSRGISGVVDYALSARRPLALTRSYMFKHMWEASPSIFIEDRTIKQIFADGLSPLQSFYDKWSELQLIAAYERMIATILV